jgi:Asp-tRNA(Asn)/Glu-tRNA(Gln) amidotransferase A subunit family amidase
MRDLAKLSAVDAAKQTRAGAISAAELVEAALERTARETHRAHPPLPACPCSLGVNCADNSLQVATYRRCLPSP